MAQRFSQSGLQACLGKVGQEPTPRAQTSEIGVVLLLPWKKKEHCGHSVILVASSKSRTTDIGPNRTEFLSECTESQNSFYCFFSQTSIWSGALNHFEGRSLAALEWIWRRFYTF